MTESPDADLVEHLSSMGFAATLERLEKAIAAAGMTVFARIDHAAGARDAGMIMPPTMVLMYGNPKGGTPIMLGAPLVALDLPLRVLLRQEADGRVLLSFHPIVPLLLRAGVPEALAKRLEPAQRLLVDAIN